MLLHFTDYKSQFWLNSNEGSSLKYLFVFDHLIEWIPSSPVCMLDNNKEIKYFKKRLCCWLALNDVVFLMFWLCKQGGQNIE